MRKKAIEKLKKLYLPEDIGIEQGRKRLHILLYFIISAPIIVIMTILDIVEHKNLEIVIDIIALSSMFAAVFFLFFIRKDMILYRVISAFIIFAILFHNSKMSIYGLPMLWYYPLPLFLLFLFGRKEGLFWICGTFFGAIFLLFNTDIFKSYPYDLPEKLIIISTFIIVIFFAYVFEMFRAKYYNNLEVAKAEVDRSEKELREVNEELKNTKIEQEKTINELQRALKEIKTLSGLLPICANCKKIRDDKGYWNQIEEYLAIHSNVDFSHGICPECAKKLYPDIYLKSRDIEKNKPPRQEIEE